jgi:hypothetical protein
LMMRRMRNEKFEACVRTLSVSEGRFLFVFALESLL